MTPTGRTLSWSDFRPSRLQSVRRKVIEEHPSTGRKLRAASGSALEELKLKIENAGQAEEALKRLAGELTASQVRGLAVQIGPWEELRDRLAVMLRARQRASLLPHLWSTWQRYPAVPAIQGLLQDLADEHGWSEVAEGYEAAAKSWSEADQPSVAIQEWLDDQGLSYSDIPELVGLPLDKDAPLVRRVRDAVMAHGSAAQLRTEGADRLVDWFPELPSDDRKLFGTSYLVSLDVARWAPDVLEMLRESYGSPKGGRQAFWEQVPEEVRTAFHRWFIERNLEEALGSDTERHQYWLGWKDELHDVELGQAGQVEYAVLYFEDFGVIEFFETGNAAYFYPLDKLRKIHRKSATHPSDLKDKFLPGFGRHGDNRLIHRERWQGKADRQVRSWQRYSG